MPCYPGQVEYLSDQVHFVCHLPSGQSHFLACTCDIRSHKNFFDFAMFTFLCNLPVDNCTKTLMLQPCSLGRSPLAAIGYSYIAVTKAAAEVCLGVAIHLTTCWLSSCRTVIDFYDLTGWSQMRCWPLQISVGFFLSSVHVYNNVCFEYKYLGLFIFD